MALIDGLVSHYKLDEVSGNRSDSHGSFTLTDINTVGSTTGLINDAASFVFANSEVLEISNDLGITNGAISISIWVKLRSEITTGIWGFAIKGDSGTHVHYTIGYEYNAGTRRVYVNRQKQNTSNNLVRANVTMGTSTWHHLVLTYDGSTLQGYLNGTSMGTLATSGNGASAGQETFKIGRDSSGYPGGTLGYCDADIDEGDVWNRAITSAEVIELYNGGAGLAYPFSAGTPLFKGLMMMGVGT